MRITKISISEMHSKKTLFQSSKRLSFITSVDRFNQTSSGIDLKRAHKNLVKYLQETLPRKSVSFYKYDKILIENLIKKSSMDNNITKLLTTCLAGGFGIRQANIVLDCYENTGEDYSENIIRLYKKALERKELFSLPNSNDTSEVKMLFDHSLKKIIKCIYFLGEDTTEYAFNLKLQRFNNLLDKINEYDNNQMFYIKEALLEKINPEKSSLYIELKEELNHAYVKLYASMPQEYIEIYNVNNQKIDALKNEISELKKGYSNDTKSIIKSKQEEIKQLRREIQETKTQEFISNEKNITNIKAKLNKLTKSALIDPQDKIQAFYLHNTVAQKSVLYNDFEKLNQLLPVKTKTEKINLNNYLKSLFIEYTEKPAINKMFEDINIETNPYYLTLFNAKPEFIEKLNNLAEIYLQEPNKSLLEKLNELEQNRNTKLCFEKMGADYNAWCKVDAQKDILIDGDMTIRKIDMNDIFHSLFLGNQVSCCTAIGSPKHSSAVEYIMNKFISGIEVLVGDDVVANTLCYLAKINDKPAFILDNIEAITPWFSSSKLKNNIINFAKNFANNIGLPDIPIYAGKRNKVFLSEFKEVEYATLQIQGYCPSDIYLDSASSFSYFIKPEIKYFKDFYQIR